MSTDTSTRRDRVIMGLGIVALLLFVANVFQAVKERFFDHQPREETIVVHEMHTVPHTPHVVVAPLVEHRIRVSTDRIDRTEAMVRLKLRLTEEADRLAAEAAQLAEAGHVDASIPLQESVDDVRQRIAELQKELDRMRERLQADEDFSFTVVAPQSN